MTTSTAVVTKVLKLVEDATAIPVWQILSDRRHAHISRARFLVCYVAHKVNGITSMEVGRILSRDHATVLHGCKVTQQTMLKDRVFHEMVDAVSQQARHLTPDRFAGDAADEVLTLYARLPVDEKIRFLTKAALMGTDEAEPAERAA